MSTQAHTRRRLTGPIRLDEDWHVHSTFSDGRDTMATNVRAAHETGLRTLCLVDHVRADTPWVGGFVAEARRVGRCAPLRVLCGVETKILDTAGRLDLPPDHALADRVLIADHQLPTPRGPMDPARARALIATGELEADLAVSWLLQGSSHALQAHPGAILAHPFSILPKLGLGPAAVNPAALDSLLCAVRESGGAIEISERWRCPAGWVAQAALDAGVRVLASTDSHAACDIGRYEHWAPEVSAMSFVGTEALTSAVP